MRLVDRMGFEPTTFAGFLLTQCECVIQTKLDDRSNKFTKLQAFLSLDYRKISLFLDPECSVLQSQVWISTFSASCSIYVISGSALEANFHYKTCLLCNAFLFRISNWHLIHSKISLFYSNRIFPSSLLIILVLLQVSLLLECQLC